MSRASQFANQAAPAEEDTTPATSTEPKKPLPLPEPPSAGEGSGDGQRTTTLDLSSGSSSVALDHLGPLVVNQDGTMARIANWAEMSEIERQNTLRVLGKRNQLRLAKLREAASNESGQQSS